MADDWPRIKAGIFAGESGGDYDALYGYSHRPGGQFAGTKLTGMTVDQAIQFADPSGPYAQWVKNQIGRVATPMGGFQVVGSTLAKAKEWAGLTGSELMTPETQDLIGQAILKNQGTDAWEGYKGPATPAAPKSSLNPDDMPPMSLSGIGSPDVPPPWTPPAGGPAVIAGPDTPATPASPYALPPSGKKDSGLAAMGKAMMSAPGAPWKLPQVEQTPGAARIDQPAAPVLDPALSAGRREQLAAILARLNQGSLV